MIVYEDRKGKQTEVINTEIDEHIAEGRDKIKFFNWMAGGDMFGWADVTLYRRLGRFYKTYRDPLGRMNWKFVTTQEAKSFILRFKREKFVELFGGTEE